MCARNSLWARDNFDSAQKEIWTREKYLFHRIFYDSHTRFFYNIQMQIKFSCISPLHARHNMFITCTMLYNVFHVIIFFSGELTATISLFDKTEKYCVGLKRYTRLLYGRYFQVNDPKIARLLSRTVPTPENYRQSKQAIRT